MLTEFHINKGSTNVVDNQLCLLCFLNPMYLTSGGKCGSGKDQLYINIAYFQGLMSVSSR